MKVWIGIDPGLKGAIAVVDENGAIVSLTPMPVDDDGVNAIEVMEMLMAWIDNAEAVKVVLEKGQAMPGQGVSSCFNYGYGCGALYAVCRCLKLQTTLVRPQTWTKVMHQGTDGGEAKDRSRVAAMRTWPEEKWGVEGRKKKPHDGLIDAALIAEWGRRVVG